MSAITAMTLPITSTPKTNRFIALPLVVDRSSLRPLRLRSPTGERRHVELRRSSETPQGIHQPVDVLLVVVGVQGDSEPARPAAADDLRLGGETLRGHRGIVFGMA